MSKPIDAKRPSIEIGDRVIGAGYPCFIIAEAGVNHNGNVSLAHRLIDVAAEARVDAVKFQMFDPEALVAPDAPLAQYQTRSFSEGGQRDLLRNLMLPEAAWPELVAHARERGLIFLATPFDERSLEKLVHLGSPAIKVGSGDLTNYLLLRKVAASGKPVLLSTGMSTLGEVEEALRVLRDGGTASVAVLHCVSAYPASPADVNLLAMRTMANAFQVPVGFSDHTPGLEVAVAAVALEAALLEKHFTLDRGLPGPDHSASLEPSELVEMVRAVRSVERALGDGVKRPTPAEEEIRRVARRSLALRVDLPAGSVITAEHLTALRPADGIAPSLLSLVVGRTVRRPLRGGQRLQWEDLV